MDLLSKCEHYIKHNSLNTNPAIYELCFYLLGGYTTTTAEEDKLKEFFNT